MQDPGNQLPAEARAQGLRRLSVPAGHRGVALILFDGDLQVSGHVWKTGVADKL